jgi:thermitase
MLKVSIGILMGLMMTVAMAQDSSERYHPNHLFIKMKAGEALVKSPLIKKSKKIIEGLYLVKTPNADALAKSLGSEAIEYVQRDYFAGKRALPKLEVLDPIELQFKKLSNFNFQSFNDEYVSRLWAFGEKGLDVNGAYASLPNWTPEEVIVAVVDTGVDHNHEDLRDIMWTNPGEIPGDRIDNDGNGYIDDVYGINTLVRDQAGRATGDTMASHWHGTHVAGTIAATQNNGIGIAGVANNVKIMAMRTVPDNADELDSNIVEAFTYAAKMGAKVINCSFGKSHNEGGMVVRDVINEIGRKYNVLVVVSSGNDSWGPFAWHNNDESPKYPASFDSPNMLVIASSTSSGGLSNFSNIGKVTVDVASPGSSIYSTVNNNRYSSSSGTSMAAPNASGVAAMVLGYYPRLKVSGLKLSLTGSVTKVKEFEEKMSSGGRLNLKKALEKAAKIRN